VSLSAGAPADDLRNSSHGRILHQILTQIVEDCLRDPAEALPRAPLPALLVQSPFSPFLDLHIWFTGH
jgi:hypothetical protein